MLWMLIFPVCTIIICITLGYIKEMHYAYHEKIEEKKYAFDQSHSESSQVKSLEMTCDELTKEVSELKQKVSALSLKAGFK